MCNTAGKKKCINYKHINLNIKLKGTSVTNYFHTLIYLKAKKYCLIRIDEIKELSDFVLIILPKKKKRYSRCAIINDVRMGYKLAQGNSNLTVSSNLRNKTPAPQLLTLPSHRWVIPCF